MSSGKSLFETITELLAVYDAACEARSMTAVFTAIEALRPYVVIMKPPTYAKTEAFPECQSST